MDIRVVIQLNNGTTVVSDIEKDVSLEKYKQAMKAVKSIVGVAAYMNCGVEGIERIIPMQAISQVYIEKIEPAKE